ncbi:MAG: YabP family protein [Pelotomaculum sp. PtaU1.Bin035]|nr:MAG: YabP family protein [Pelotomaculum sp. PtaU1.Bin035]
MSWIDLKRKFKRQLSDFLEIPGDVMLDLPKIVLVGNIQLFIENHRGIIEYTADVVRVSVGEGEVAVAGENLTLRNLLPDELHIEGKIRSLSFN